MTALAIEELDELFSNLEELDFDKIELFVGKSLSLFDTIQAKLNSSSEEEKNEALTLAEQLKERFEKLSIATREKSGLSNTEASQFASVAENFSNEEWSRLQASQEKINAYQQPSEPLQTALSYRPRTRLRQKV